MRLERSNNTAARLVDYLSTHPKIRKIYYLLASNEQFELAKSQMRRGGLLSIELDTDEKTKVNDFVNAWTDFCWLFHGGDTSRSKMPSLAFLRCAWATGSSTPIPIGRLHAGLEGRLFDRQP